jgi:2-dehydro-3-deoxyphosphooctonate aldolase (KDO 8-P synthase)
MLDSYSSQIVFDVTHSVQAPGGAGDSSSGNSKYVPGLARAASALGVSNFFLEVHADPNNAPSDGANMLHLYDFEQVVEDVVNFHYDRRK